MFYGWYVVGVAFVLAVWAWGLGFYGLGIYLVGLGARHGWAISTVSLAITAYYLIGAAVTATIGDVMKRLGPHRAVAGGVIAMALGVAALGLIDQVWQLYAALAVMAVGWGAMSGAAINIVLAPWFERRRGAAVSLALTGASGGGIIIAPGLLLLIHHLGFGAALQLGAVAMVAMLLPMALVVLRRTPADLGVGPDGDPAPPRQETTTAATGRSRLRAEALASRSYWTISIAFATGLAAQVGVLTHLVSHLTPLLGAAGAGGALSLTTAAAIAGRVPMGLLADRMDRRTLAGLNFAMQVAGIGLLASSASTLAVYAGCVLFGLGVGNVITLPGLLVEREFPREQFAGVVSLIVATNQVAFAFAPGLIGVLRDAAGDYALALGLCAGADLLAAAVIVLGRSRRSPDARRGRAPRTGAAPPAASASTASAVGLALRPNCECCDRDLPPDSRDAVICSFECTFCRSCAERVLGWRCPNCGGELVRRPVRPAAALARHPASTARVVKPTPCATLPGDDRSATAA